MMNAIRNVSLLNILIILTQISCTDNLSREDAKKILTNWTKMPLGEAQIISDYYAVKNDYKTSKIIYKTEPIYGDVTFRALDIENFIANDLLKISVERSRNFDNTWFTAKIDLTPKGALHRYSTNTGEIFVRFNDLTIDEVTGIHIDNEKGVADIEFSIRRVNFSPFGNFYHLNDPDNYIEIISGLKTEFQKYDDGWRISPNAKLPKINYYTYSSKLTLIDEDVDILSKCTYSGYLVKINGSNVRLRAEPDISQNNVVAMLNTGDETIHIGDTIIKDQKWFNVCYSGTIGWVSGQFANQTNEKPINLGNDDFTGFWEGNEATMTISKTSDGRYSILYEDIEGTSLKYIGDVEKGILKYVDPDYNGKSAIRFVIFSSANCFKDGMYEFCKK